MPSYEMIHIEGVIFSNAPQTGALVVYCPKKYRGKNAQVALNAKIFGDQVEVQVIERRVNGSKQYVAAFPSLPAGTHQVGISMVRGSARRFSVFPGSVAEVDYR